MVIDISDESFWAVIALFFLWIKFGSNWADNAVFTVPEWEFCWAAAGFVGWVPGHGVTLLIGWAFALFCGWVDLSWGWTWDFTVTSVELNIVEMTLWARLTFSTDSIPEERSGTLNTIVTNFIISSWAA